MTRERLCSLGSIIRTTREGAVERHDPKAGDGPWGLGCSAYERTFFALKAACAKYPWLTVTQDPAKPLRFAFAIGHVPFRIYSGGAEQPPSKYLSTTYVELHEIQLALDLGVIVPPDGILRIAVETDETGLVSRISVVQIDEAQHITGIYVIPPDEAESSSTVPMQTPPVDLPPPVIAALPKIDEGKKRKAQNDSEG